MPEQQDPLLQNGQVWEQEGTWLQARTQWLNDDTWILLSTPSRAAHGETCMVAMSDANGRIFYRAGELREFLDRGHWRRIDVSIERVLQDCERYPAA